MEETVLQQPEKQFLLGTMKITLDFSFHIYSIL